MANPAQLNFDLRKNRFASCLWLDNIFPKKFRRGIAKTFDLFIILSFTAIILFTVRDFENNAVFKEKAIDYLFLILSFRLVLFALESFYRSRSSESRTGPFPDSRSVLDRAEYLNFEAADLIFKTVYRRKLISGINILKTFSETEIGKFAFLHLGISAKDFRKGLDKIFPGKSEKEDSSFFLKNILSKIQLKNMEEIGVGDIILEIMEEERIFRIFFEMKIRKEDINGVVEWASVVSQKLKKASYWWLEENLARIQGLAKNWAYGDTYLLDRYSRAFSENHPVGEHQILHFTGHQKQVEAVEAALSRTAQENVLLIGEPGVGKRTIVAGLNNMINTGKIRPELEFKRLLELDASSFVANAKTKGDLENLIIRLFNDAVRAGNIIMIIDNFSEFLKSAENLGVSLIQVLSPYFESSALQIIAIADSSGSKRFLESDSSLMKYFEIIRVEEPDSQELLQILEDVCLEIEGARKVLVLFQTIREVVNASTAYLTEGALPERAINILETVSARAAGRENGIMMPEDILEFVNTKTKMPLGILRPEEKEKLLKLEEFLHKRVIAQDEAISTISAAVRRVRMGLQETKKPLASFLFLGPTGVGKTETAKALAESYFGNEEAMTRFDMSEYQNEGGLERLIGAFEKNEPGLLASKLRERPYGLLLLDEFEKCHLKVMDLFMQILDEGFFTDAFGKKVFTRNHIIIATSNAASQLIWEMGKEGIDPSSLKETVISAIQKAGTFKAELLNRFNAIIVFHHLNPKNLKMIAKLMLEKLRKRLLAQKEIDLAINDVLIDKVAEIGYDPVFGARPMQRAIQERVEKKIAEWIIAEKIDRGAKIEFKAGDLEEI